MSKLLFPNRGQGKELCEILREALGIPETCTGFTVRFGTNEPVAVNCDYYPQEVPDEEDLEQPAVNHRGLDG
ncbi:hypothetical protein [Xenophilus sp.]|uniref:hypothetical protein n=1 Tax=Xenophilus sp. TaxID=1873499 RepID=UPI0037DDA862